MGTNVKKLYESLFLIDSVKAASEWEQTVGVIRSILEKAQADVVSIRKWDERQLAYKIRGRDRGAYILCYFTAPAGNIDAIGKAVRLSELFMRVLILSADLISQQDIDKDTPAMIAEKSLQNAALPQQQAEQQPGSQQAEPLQPETGGECQAEA